MASTLPLQRSVLLSGAPGDPVLSTVINRHADDNGQEKEEEINALVEHTRVHAVLYAVGPLELRIRALMTCGTGEANWKS